MKRFAPFAFLSDIASRWDVLAFIVVIGLIVFLGETSRGLFAPLTALEATPISLNPAYLPEYAARTTFRMFAALALSLVFTLTYATWAAKSERAGKLLVPMLDILQSVPILGFISITVVFFMSLAPGRVLGAEFAAIFAIFTSQAWNMAFSFYQSLRTIPIELIEAAESFRLSPWMRFWQLEVPFAMPALIWNMMMSMSGGWFFVVASESISVGHTTVALPGIGSYIATAIAQKNLAAIGWAIATMLIVILLYDQLLFRPLVAWADRFRVEQEPGERVPDSWALTMMRRSRLIQTASLAFHSIVMFTSRAVKRRDEPLEPPENTPKRSLDLLWVLLIVAAVVAGLWHIVVVLIQNTSWREALQVCGLATLTMLRVFILIALASLLWVPIGVWVGMRPRAAQIVQPVAQFMAAFPANLLFPIAVFGIVRWKLNPDIYLSPLMILGTQWYILFNVIAGASSIPSEMRYAAANFGVTGWLWWRKVALPAILPFYVTGAITASGGSWNAAIVAELATWGDTQVQARGLGSYIAEATTAGDFHRIVLGIGTMSLFVVIINRLFWRPLYYYAERKYRLT
ncbi:MAG: NitT/TauT family transport system permease protein [Gammaproteobacteria bacterium]|jgi:NitT/TauT family transport system permease protein|nr:NitT/TauT family transport system permease protein [Gammaproteobacteria bacterium]